MADYSVPKLTMAQWGQFMHGFFPGKPTYTETQYPKLDGKVVLITGGNTGIGYETAKSLAASTNAKIYIFARTEEKTLKAIKQIEKEVALEYKKSPINKINFIKVDLSDLTTIKPAVEEFLSIESRLDIVILNAGVMHPPPGSKTKQGYELQLGTNCIGHHLLQKLLDPVLIQTSKTNKPNESRIVWVSSTAHLFSPRGGFNFDTPNYDAKTDANLKYGQSKAVNAIQARYWPNAHTDADGIVSVSICPGYLASDLIRSYGAVHRWIMLRLFRPVRYGAYTELFAALSPDVTTANNGDHYISLGKHASLRPDLIDDHNNAKVWQYLEDQVAPYY